jgi:hypothetical protein
MRDLVASRRLVAALGVSGQEASPSPQRRSVHAVQNHWTWWKLHLAVDPDSDEILASEPTTTEYGGRNLVGLSAPEIARLGIGYVPQERGLFAGMSVAENLMLGRLRRRTGAGRH